MNQQQIGAFIAKVRKEKGITQEKLAEALGVSQKSISRWENGKTMPDLSLYEPLCQLLEVQVSELLYGKRMTIEEKAEVGETTAKRLMVTKSQLELFAIFTELLIVVGIVISFTLTRFLAKNTFEMIITLLSGWFVWGFGLLLRRKIKKAIKEIQ